jgi:hypothetical protein
VKVPYCTKQVMLGEEYTYDYEIFKNKHPIITPMQVENILDLGYMGVKNDFPTVKYVYYHLERKGKVNCQVEEKRNIIESIPN